jgi:energy-converting hydrogenase Eha subunit C
VRWRQGDSTMATVRWRQRDSIIVLSYCRHRIIALSSSRYRSVAIALSHCRPLHCRNVALSYCSHRTIAIALSHCRHHTVVVSLSHYCTIELSPSGLESISTMALTVFRKYLIWFIYVYTQCYVLTRGRVLYFPKT